MYITDHDYPTIVAIDINATINLNDKVLKIINYHKFNDILVKNKWSDIYIVKIMSMYMLIHY